MQISTRLSVKFKMRTWSTDRIKPNATNEEIYDTGAAVAQIVDDELVSIGVVEKFLLI